MYRRSVAVIVAVYALAFSLAAMAVIRWPSVMMAVGFLTGVHDDAIDWREFGILYGAPYFAAALLFYAAAVAASARKRGATTGFTLGCLAGFPFAFLVEFRTEWWRAPTIPEATIAFAGAISVLLAWALWDLRPRRVRKPKIAVDAAAYEPPMIAAPAPVEPVRPPRRVGPASAAILRQRASFALEGRKMAARRRRVTW